MNTAEAAKLLAFAAAFEPSMTVTREIAAIWAEVLDDITIADATTALKAHYRSSSYPIRPADIVQGVKDIHRQRAQEAGDPTEPPDDLEPGAYHLWLKAYWHGVKEGRGRDGALAYADLESGGTRRQLGPPTRHTINELTEPSPTAGVSSCPKEHQ